MYLLTTDELIFGEMPGTTVNGRRAESDGVRLLLIVPH